MDPSSAHSVSARSCRSKSHNHHSGVPHLPCCAFPDEAFLSSYEHDLPMSQEIHSLLTSGARVLPVGPRPEVEAHLGDEYFRSKLQCPVVDAHVHVFPEKLMKAVQAFFRQFYAPVAYEGHTGSFLLSHGVSHVVLISYAHKDGIAQGLNEYTLSLVKEYEKVFGAGAATGLATVHPGEKGAAGVVDEAIRSGLKGIKMHAHVQACRVNDPRMMEIYPVLVKHNAPILVHAGTLPNVAIPAKQLDDTRDVCHPDFVREVLERFPTLKMVIPHLGRGETEEYLKLMDKHPNLYLDTTTCFTSPTYSDLSLDPSPLRAAILRFPDNVLYGSDFPNIGYRWDKELRCLVSHTTGNGDSSRAWEERGSRGMDLSTDVLEKVLWKNACTVYGIDPEAVVKRWERAKSGGSEPSGRL
ncbi:hypothetical protein M427DRAFT_469379 [Gonapodya prolifera JEL478]|uniref:Amidohydrolase-related domain-containing protein n=1 Tax=Gonapodya prolifera (strain JEL478) TaxID=1344416 RepID=A0A139AQX0_GONPJ|nr:hypothetical protein M427DRAFT_469379 [Gonapodya prolifera JEL478]|eukprot:KXS19128.1 hypothetical protein M427DRAFT_469379 [Gonapodya prolifera JEL478]